MKKKVDNKGKFFIIADLKFSEYMKDKEGNTILYNTYQEASDTCGIYEFDDFLICEIKYNS